MATFGSFEPNRFDLIKQFDAMRNQESALKALGPAEAKYSPPDIDVSMPGTSGRSSSWSEIRGGTVPGQASGKRTGKLVSYGGIQFDEGMMPVAQALSSEFGLRLSSGYRDPVHNRRVGGVPNSHHLYGGAIDFSGPVDKLYTAAARARELGYHTLVHNAGSGLHLHVSF